MLRTQFSSLTTSLLQCTLFFLLKERNSRVCQGKEIFVLSIHTGSYVEKVNVCWQIRGIAEDGKMLDCVSKGGLENPHFSNESSPVLTLAGLLLPVPKLA